jgi:mannose-6-phosphate isomerase-like protein (cupin superfamily)
MFSKAIFCITACGLLLQSATVRAQNDTTAPAKYISKAQVMEGLDKSQSPIGLLGGQTFTIIPEMVVRRRLEGPNNASIHSVATDGTDANEVMEIIDGTATFVSGGTLVNDSHLPYSKIDRTKGIVGGVSQEVKPGDFLVVPAGTAHWFSKINGHVTVVELRLPVSPSKEKK